LAASPSDPLLCRPPTPSPPRAQPPDLPRPQAPGAFLSSPLPGFGLAPGAFRGGQTTPGLHGAKSLAGAGSLVPWDHGAAAGGGGGHAGGSGGGGGDLTAYGGGGGKELAGVGAEITPLAVDPSIGFDQVGRGRGMG
jgi:hypothetical protein